MQYRHNIQIDGLLPVDNDPLATTQKIENVIGPRYERSIFKQRIALGKALLAKKVTNRSILKLLAERPIFKQI